MQLTSTQMRWLSESAKLTNNAKRLGDSFTWIRNFTTLKGDVKLKCHIWYLVSGEIYYKSSFNLTFNYMAT